MGEKHLKLYPFEEVKDEFLGKVGTPGRDSYEREVAEALHAYHIGEAIKQARKSKNLTQEQLGELVGVQKAQISRLEKGKSITWATLTRVLKAMNIPATLDLAGVGKIALW